MIKIKADVNNEEQVFEFQKSTENDLLVWKGVSKPEPATISFSANTTETPSYSTISASANVTTPFEIIYERFVEALTIFNEKERAGLEDNEGDEKNTTTISPYDPESIKVRRETFSAYQLNRMMTIQKDIDAIAFKYTLTFWFVNRGRT